MKLLEARFHPGGRIVAFVVVGRLLCYEDHATVEPSTNRGRITSRPSLVTNLRYLVAMNAWRPFESLQALHSPLWSFVEIETSCSNEATPQTHHPGNEIK